MFNSFKRSTAACQRMIMHQQRCINNVKVDQLFGKYSVITANEGDSLRSVAQIMEKEKIGAVMIESAKDKIVGILTARDVQQAVAQSDDVSNVKAKDAMTPRDRLATAKKGDSLEKLATTMMEKNIRHIPLMSGELCQGMLSIKDVVGAVLRMEKEENEHLHDIVTDIYSHKHSVNIDK